MPPLQLLRAADIAAMPGEQKTHFLNPNAVRLNKSLGDAVGLQQLGVHLIEVAPGHDSTEQHLHHYEEECVYVLSGTATLCIGDQRFAVAAGDFIGHPVRGEAHMLTNTGSEPLVCLVMGQRLGQDISDYPRQGKRLYRHSGEWDAVELAQLTRIR